MKTVTCTLDNASETINGLAFTRQRDGSVSATLEDAIALQFEGIPGYRLSDAGKGQNAKQPPLPDEDK